MTDHSPESPKHRFGFTPAAVPHGIPTGWMRLAGLAVFVSLLVQHGFPIGQAAARWFNLLNSLFAIIYGVDLIVPLLKAPDARKVFAVRRLEFVALIVFGLLLLGTATFSASTQDQLMRVLHASSTGAVVFALLKIFLLWLIGMQALRAAQRLLLSGVRPELVLASSFGLLIAAGTLLLVLPNSSARAEQPITVVDAFFTATSAACVTGLVVRDTGSDFSTFGQVIILGLFQAGGLGIVTFVGFLSVFSTRALPVPQMVLFRQVVFAPASSDLKRQFTGILLTTMVVELVGVMLLLHFCPIQGDFIQRIGWSVFHAVSAFCNAGFALQPDSLMPYANNAGVILSISGLIVLGGLGFLVIPELLTLRRTRTSWFRLTRRPLFRRLTFFRQPYAGGVTLRLSVQARLALTTMGVLLVGGFLGFWLLEDNHLLAARTPGQSALAAAFQSVTTRTAGFNTMPIDQLQGPSVVLTMILMVIGANPVSTGGGIKTVSFGVLLLSLRSMVTRRDRVEAFGRTIPVRTLIAALSVFGIYVACAAMAVFLLTFTDPRFSLQQHAFEAISALSTVGLSMGITPELSIPGKLVICAAMFIGRVGPISLVLTVFHSRGQVTYEFPEEEVVVG